LHVVTRDGLFAAKISSMFCLFVGKNMAEVLPTNYEAICKDRIDGGVLIAVKNTLISQDLEIKSDCEIVVSRIECSKKKRP
jgi:hypothetical protein